jgi:hypothetical protein
MPGTTICPQPRSPMTPCIRLQRWSACFAIAIGLALVFGGCAKVPRQYVRMAEPGTTLTKLITHPELYHQKVVLLGGVIVEEEETDQYLWLRVRNRPLDQEYVPHRPIDMDGLEGGHYWMVVAKQQLPREYREWGRMTAAGRVTGMRRYEKEPVLWLLYVRGWDARVKHHGIWEHIDPNYIPLIPGR